ncbi:MAG: acetate--CoA ligase family protein [Candidatus Binatia bacterium]
MHFFFDPKSVAIIGASRDPMRGGHRILKNVKTGFQGSIYPVNPLCDEIDGLRCYPSVLDIPEPVDLAIVYVPARLVPGVVRDCAKRGVPGVIIESAGFAETGAAGKVRQDELKQIAAETGIRLWGPNCMGLVDMVKRHVFSFVVGSIWDAGALIGDVSLIVQSGFLSAGFVVDLMSHRGVGISKACSIGNKVDVDECDVLEWLLDDPHTKAIGLYLESVANGRRFMNLCRRSRKPIVVLKGGKSARGAEAAMSHTASLAGHGGVVSGALAQAGVVEAHDFAQMMDICRTLARFPEPPKTNRRRVAIITGSGGAGIVSADFVDEVGLELAELSETTRRELARVYPEWMPVANPVDLFPAIDANGPDAYRVAFEALCADPDVDAVLFHLFGLRAGNDWFSALAETIRRSGKPVIGWLIGRRDVLEQAQRRAAEEGIPVFRELYRATECLAAVLKQPAPGNGSAPELSDARDVAAEVKVMLTEASGVLDEHLSKRILAATGLPVVEERLVASVDEAGTAAVELGFPVVMKGLPPGKIHKTELGLVRLGIVSRREVGAQFRSLMGAMSGTGAVLVQRQVRAELELIVGMIRDPQFGPCVMLGLGGVMAEVFRDTVFAMAPLTRSDALRLIARLGAQRLLDGFRGAPAVDREALARILMRVGQLSCACPSVREIDINPLLVSNGQAVAVDASIIVDG